MNMTIEELIFIMKDAESYYEDIHRKMTSSDTRDKSEALYLKSNQIQRYLGIHAGELSEKCRVIKDLAERNLTKEGVKYVALTIPFPRSLPRVFGGG